MLFNFGVQRTYLPPLRTLFLNYTQLSENNTPLILILCEPNFQHEPWLHIVVYVLCVCYIGLLYAYHRLLAA